MNLNKSYFFEYSDIRKNLEQACFRQSVQLLDQTKINELRKLIYFARSKLAGEPI